MELRLKATSGPVNGQIFAVKDGMIIGRQDAAINLNDPRVSSVHARVIKDPDGRFRLRDNESKNGIRDSAGQKVTALELKPGLRFGIGESQFEVLAPEPAHAHAVERRHPAPAPVAPVVTVAPTPAPPKAEPSRPKSKRARNQVFWHEALYGFLESHAPSFQDRIKPTAAFNPALVLEFVRGPQVHARWVLGFGPRQIGAASVDLPLWEPDAPAVCFQIHPNADGIVFSTATPKLVRLNGQAVDSQLLSVGDRIEINETLIEVDFTE